MRKINEQVIEKMVKDFLNGILNPLLDLLQHDDTLDLEIRENYMNIYYRGGSLFKLMPENKIFKTVFNLNYYNIENEIDDSDTEINIEVIYISDSESCKEFVNIIKNRKQVMDRWFSNHPKLEREFQQIIARENNLSQKSNFYICDIEVTDQSSSSRFDMTLIQRPDRSPYSKLKLYVAELKYGDSAIKEKSGIVDHYVKTTKIPLSELKSMRESALLILNFKKEMKLIKLNKNHKDLTMSFEENSDNRLSLIYYIAGYAKKHKQKLINCFLEIKEISLQQKGEVQIDVYLFNPFMAGYLMYDDAVYTLDEFL